MPRPKVTTGLASLLLLSVPPGCASDRSQPVRSPDGISHSSTIGSDLRRAPRGITIPPPALGVDLVGLTPGTPGVSTRPDPAVLPAEETADLPGNRRDRRNR